MIDVKEAIAVLKQFKEESQKHKDSYTPIGSNLSPVLKIMQDTYQENIDAFEMAIKSLERTRWIPVSERLPDDSELVMLFAPAGTYTDFDWYDFGIYHKGSNSFLHIGFPLCAQFLPTSTHWMRLPNPPEVE